MSNASWEAREPGFREWRQELMRLWHRARKRKLAVLALALTMAGAVCLLRWRKLEAYEASVTFRVSEGQSTTLNKLAPPPTKELREYVGSIALSSTKVLDVMKKHSIKLKMIDADPVKAVQLFREDLGIEVSRNYFIEEWRENKSARLTLSYMAGTAKDAQAIVTDLAQLVIDDESRRRQATVDAAIVAADETLAAAQREVDRRNTRLAELEGAVATADKARKTALLIEINNLKAGLPEALDRLKMARGTRDELALSLLAENQSLAVRFEKVDESIEAITRPASPSVLIILGTIVFILGLPISVMAVGAFDKRVYDLDDVGRLGLTPVGHVPPFRGAQVGSLRDRRTHE